MTKSLTSMSLKSSPTLISYPLHPRVEAFTTTRRSPFALTGDEEREMGQYAAFNVTDYCGDDPARVERNKLWLCGRLGIPASRFILPRQTHTDRVYCIDEEYFSKPEAEKQSAINEVDALITDVRGVCIGISTADCVPLLVYDPARHAAAAVHSGWRGTVKRIVQNALAAMQRRYGTQPADCLALIGPAISAEAFEVSPDVADAFLQAAFPPSVVLPPGPSRPKPHIDLWRANRFLLEEIGLAPESVQVMGMCTRFWADTLFSARRQGIRSGRLYSGIILR